MDFTDRQDGGGKVRRKLVLLTVNKLDVLLTRQNISQSVTIVMYVLA